MNPALDTATGALHIAVRGTHGRPARRDAQRGGRGTAEDDLRAAALHDGWQRLRERGARSAERFGQREAGGLEFDHRRFVAQRQRQAFASGVKRSGSPGKKRLPTAFVAYLMADTVRNEGPR